MSAAWNRLGIYLLFTAALPLCAQNFGEITGAVTDPSGAIVVGATVTVTNAATNVARKVQTNATGNYTAPFLVPGVYNVRAEQQGFGTETRSGIQLQVGAVARIDFKLEVGGVSEVVDVKGGATLIATESTAVGTVVENRRIIELPLNGRNYLQLLSLSTNVTAEAGTSVSAAGKVGGDRSAQNFAIAGTRLQFNNFTLDGIANTDPNFNTFVFRPSIEALQEFKVETGIYSVEYGRNPGQVSVSTKSGTNQYHVTVFEFLRNSALDAREWLQSTGAKNPFRRNQYGFTFGGRLIRDRLFFLSNFEGLRDSKTTQTVAAVATDRMRAGDFSAAGRNIFDPASRVYQLDANGNKQAISATPFAGNVIPPSRIDSVAAKLLAFYPKATAPGDSINRNYIRQGPHPTTQDQFTQRIDFNESLKSFWFGRFGWNDEYVRQRATFENQEGRIQTKAYQVMLSNIRTLSAAVVNEFRFGYTRFNNDLLTYSGLIKNPMADIPIIGMPDQGPYSWGTPSIGLGNGLTGFGENADGPYINRNHIFQWLDNVSIARGRHSFKFGGDVRRDRMNQYGQVYQRGQFTFDGTSTYDPAARGTTGYSFADFLIGNMQQFVTAPAPGQVQGRNLSFSAYAEDSWKITPKLTLTAGVRYEIVQPYHDKYRGIANMQMFDPGVGPNGLLAGTKTPVLVRPGSGSFFDGMRVHFPDSYPTAAGDSILGRALIRTDYNDVGPRLGLAYSPTTRWSIRAGFGVFFAHDIMNATLFDMARNLVARVTIPTNTETPSVPLANPYVSMGGVASQCTGWTGFCLPVTTTIFIVDNGLRTPYVEERIFNVQRQVTESMSVEVGYLGNQGHKLMRGRLYNAPIPRTGAGDASPQAKRQPWPGIGSLEGRLGEANSTYDALSVKLTQRFSKGLSYLVSYTWGKALDDSSSFRWSSGDTFTPLNPYNAHPERGMSAYHVGKRLAASAMYELPVGRGRAYLNRGGIADAILGGWQLGSVVALIDGSPTSVGTIPWNADSGSQRPDATGVSAIPDNRSSAQFWNIQAFNWTDPGLLYRRSNVARNTLLWPRNDVLGFFLLQELPPGRRAHAATSFRRFRLRKSPQLELPERGREEPLVRTHSDRQDNARTSVRAQVQLLEWELIRS